MTLAGISIMSCGEQSDPPSTATEATVGASSNNTSRGTTPTVAQRLPDLQTTGELEQMFIAFGTCVEERFPIVLTYRSESFIGLQTEIGQRLETDGPEADAVAASCAAAVDLDRRMAQWQSENPVTATQEAELVAEFESCIQSIDDSLGDAMDAAGVDSLDAAVRFTTEADASLDDFDALNACHLGLYGRSTVFADGHEWFER